MSETPRPVINLEDDARVRASWDDALERDGEMLVLAGNEVSLLSPLAVEASLAAQSGITVAELAQHLLEVFGAPEGRDVHQAVREVIAILMERGIFTVEA